MVNCIFKVLNSLATFAKHEGKIWFNLQMILTAATLVAAATVLSFTVCFKISLSDNM